MFRQAMSHTRQITTVSSPRVSLACFGATFLEMAKGGGETIDLMIDFTNLKAHRTAASLLKNWLFPGIWHAQCAVRTRNSTLFAIAKAPPQPFSDCRPSEVLCRRRRCVVEPALSEGAFGPQGLRCRMATRRPCRSEDRGLHPIEFRQENADTV